MVQDLTDIPGRPAAVSLVGLSARLEVEPRQEKQAEGVLATLTIGNSGQQPLTVLNPFELAQFQLLDGQGRPIKLSTKPPALLIHQPSAESWRTHHPIRVVRVARNEQAIDISAIDGRTIQLGSGDKIQVTVMVSHVRVGKGGAEVDAPIIDGHYRIGCIATLIHANHTNDSRILQAPPIEVIFERRR